MIGPGELYACLYVNEFPAQAILRLRPELQSRPCVVMEGEPPLETVCSLNARARFLQLEHGMTRVEVDTFPDVAVLSRSFETESAARAMLLESAGTFSPRIEERSAGIAFLCGIDIAGTQSLFGSPEMLARRLLKCVRALGIRSRISVSINLHAAICLARGMPFKTSVAVIPPGEEAPMLAALPVAVLDPAEAQTETFARWGIHTLGMLAELSEKELIARMGQDARRLLQLAKGQHPHLFQPVEPPFILAEKLEFDSPIEFLDSVLFTVGAMLDQLIHRAKARAFALASVTVRLTLEGELIHSRTIRPALPNTDKQIWIKLLHLDLEAHPPAASIVAVTLHAEPGSTSKVQLGLFSPQLPEATHLDVTLARIRAIVGEDCVGRAVLQDAHAPEAFCMKPFTLTSQSGTLNRCSTRRVATRSLRPPEPVSVTLRNSQPAMFFYRERSYIVESAYGPWLVSGDWWNQMLWRLEQWDLVAKAQDGVMLCCCMIRDPMQNRWQMAALYD